MLGMDQVEQGEWYYIPRGENVPKGPFTKRDLDVEWRTKSLRSDSLVWKSGMTSWIKVYDAHELKQWLDEFNKEITTEMEVAGELLKKTDSAAEKTKTKVNYYQGPDGLWHIYDPATKTWITQEEEPLVEKVEHLYGGGQHKKEPVEMLPDDYVQEEGEENKAEEDENREGSQLPAEEATPEAKIPAQKTEKEQIAAIKKKEAILGKRKQEIIEKIIPEEKLKEMQRRKEKKKRYNANRKKKWYLAKINTSIYVKGLAPELSREELDSYFGKCGVLRVDPKNGQTKIKTYANDDALISYAKIESVQLAIDMLHNSQIKEGYTISVSPAEFEQKGEYRPRFREKKDKLESFRIKTEQSRKFDWAEEDQSVAGLKIVVIKNIFTPEEVEAAESLEAFVRDLQEEIGEECGNIGIVEKIEIFERNPEGIIKIKFKHPAAAAECIDIMNKRWFSDRQLESFYWDGKVDYRRVKESRDEETKRLTEFETWILEKGKEAAEMETVTTTNTIEKEISDTQSKEPPKAEAISEKPEINEIE